MSETTERLERLIGERLAAIEAEEAELRRAAASLGAGRGPGSGRPRKPAAAFAPTPRKPRRRASKSKAPGRAARGQRREELLAAIGASPGARPAELARSMDVAPTQVHALIAKARGEKLIVRRGEGYALRR